MSLDPADLVTLKQLPDGNLEATLDRFGRLKVKFSNSPVTLEIYIRRDEKRDFRCFVTTGVEGDEKDVSRATKANDGEKPGHTHVLFNDGSLVALPEADTKKARGESTGRKAAEADAAPAAEEQSETPAADATGETAATETEANPS